MVMIVPVNSYINEAHDIGEKNRQQRFQGGELDAVRHSQFEHHDGDDDRENTIAERFESVGLHDFVFNKTGRRTKRKPLDCARLR
jgi:hypothetical protein